MSVRPRVLHPESEQVLAPVMCPVTLARARALCANSARVADEPPSLRPLSFLAAALVLGQLIVHLLVTRLLGDASSIFDLDRSNSIPGLLSAMVILLAAVGAIVLAAGRPGAERFLAPPLALSLALVAGAEP